MTFAIKAYLAFIPDGLRRISLFVVTLRLDDPRRALLPTAPRLALPIHDDLRFGGYAAFGTSGRTGSFGFFTA